MNFTGVPDPEGRLATLYGQRWGLFKMLRLPSVVVIDRAGTIRSRHDGGQMWEIPSNEEVLSLLTS